MEKNVYLHIGALPCGKQGKKTLLLVPLRQKQTHLFEPGCRTYCRSRPSWGSEGKLIKSRSMVRRCFRSFGNLSGLMGCNTNALSRGENGKGTKTGFATRKLSLFFGDKWCKSNSCCDVFSGLHVSDVVLWCTPSSATGETCWIVFFFFLIVPSCFLTACRQARRSRQFSLLRCASSMTAAPHWMLTVNHHHLRCPCGLNKSCAISRPS